MTDVSLVNLGFEGIFSAFAGAEITVMSKVKLVTMSAVNERTTFPLIKLMC